MDTGDYTDHMPGDTREGYECAFCPNPIPYLQEDIIVPTRVVLTHDGDAFYLCNDCWETAYGGADLADVTVTPNVCTIHAHA